MARWVRESGRHWQYPELPGVDLLRARALLPERMADPPTLGVPAGE
jgi:hypothetical protein